MPLWDKVSKQTSFDFSISLAKYMTATDNRKDRRTVTWNCEKKKRKVGFPGTLSSELLGPSLLFASMLVWQSIAVVLTPANEILIDIVDEYSIIGNAAQSNMTSSNLPTLCSRLLRVSVTISSEH